jgi:hypothetical protein
VPAIFYVGLGWGLFDIFIFVLFVRAGGTRELCWARRNAGAVIPAGHESRPHRDAGQTASLDRDSRSAVSDNISRPASY